MRIASPVDRFATDHQLGIVLVGETGFIIRTNPDTVRAPDGAFVRRERVPETGIPKTYWLGAPDLAVEVVSPGDTADEVDEKVEDWLTAGAKLVWVVKSKRRTVTVYRSLNSFTVLSRDEEFDGGELLPGFRCNISDLFPR